MKFVLPRRSSSLAALAIGAACAAAGGWLAHHYPVEPVAATALWAAIAVAAFFGWRVLPLLLPALVPVIGFAPWTGWITFEELDLLVLAVAAGGYAAIALTVPAVKPVPWRYRTLRWRAAVRVLMAVFGLSVGIAVWRGFESAGGLQFGFWQGFQEPMNSLRAGKSFALVLLLLPLWQKASDLRPTSVQRLSRTAWVLVLLLTSLGALWERWVYTGLLDFSTDYRTTSLYWEMNVGGASLDGALALSLPFALLWALRERRPLRFAAALAVLLLASYASLTTFSRGVYLAVPAGLGLCALLWAVQRREGLDAPRADESPSYVFPGASGSVPLGWSVGVVGGTAVAAWVLFGAGGYRALLALAGSVAVLLAMPASRAAWPRGQQRALLMLSPLPAVLLALGGGLLIELLPKGAYLIDGAVVLLGLGLGWLWRGGLTQPAQAFALAVVWMATLAGAGLVAAQWGGGRDLGPIASVLAVLAVAWIATQWSPRVGADLRTAGWRVRGLVWTACLLACAVVAALGGGAYIGQRMSTGQQDFEGRLEHWRVGLGLLKSMDEWLLGKGSGRFPASFANGGPFDERVGDYHLNAPRDELPASGLPGTEAFPGPTVTLTSGLHQVGNGEMFRLSQRVPAVAGEVAATVVLRTQFKTRLRVEICEKFLLYPLRCVDRETEVQPMNGAWQTLPLKLGVAPPDFGGPSWAPRRLVASVTQNWRGGVLEIASVSIADSVHGPLLRNGDFSEGLARWFFTSDRYHMPFHMKSLPAHVLFEQGLFGLALWTSLLVTVLWRCTFGAGRRHPLAPAVVGGLAAFVVVGLFDSLIDAPRIAFLFYALMALGLGLRTPSRRPRRPGDDDSGLGMETELPELDSDFEDAPEVRRAMAAAGVKLKGPLR
ncbi:hypothetical protein [Mitsuaria sp. GD03876]|uniref:hypothetical protein n=1 Tax=Mitsuaria sp. GD03876 TaxID=2975399 RepID=UPI00244A0A35|nr:hypothetical protein [Mitsuaria sp. GD03876]MDH0865688.1 hypothetical protein [Mitsuaria sp. GD03876]